MQSPHGEASRPKGRPAVAEDHSMSTDRPATRSGFKVQFSLASLIFMSVMAGVLLMVSFQENENWWLRYAPVNPNYGDPATRNLSTFHTKKAVGYGWPYLVFWESEHGDVSEWSWMGLGGDILMGSALIFVLGVFFERGRRWKCRNAPPRFGRRERMVLAACSIALLALNGWPRNIQASRGGSALVDVYSGRGWPWHWHSERIAHQVPWNSASVANLPVHTGFSNGRFSGTGFIFDLLAGALILGMSGAFMVFLRHHQGLKALRIWPDGPTQ